MDIDPEWLKQAAEKEDGKCVSVAGMSEEPITYAQAEAVAQEYKRAIDGGARVVLDEWTFVQGVEFEDYNSHIYLDTFEERTEFFGHDVFMPGGNDFDPAAFRAYWAERLQVYVELPPVEESPTWDDVLGAALQVQELAEGVARPEAMKEAALRLAALCVRLENNQ